MTRYHDDDISLNPLINKTVAMIGYGNQGRPQALNLKDSALSVIIGLRPSSNHTAQAQADGFCVAPISQAVANADVIMMMIPDEAMASVYQQDVAPQLKPGQYLGFCHGMAITTGWIQPQDNLNVFLLAPKAQGRGVRNRYLAGSGVPALVAVHQDVTGDTHDVALAYGKALGCGKAAILETTFAEETETNNFGEQVVLCGGLTHLAQTAFEVLVEAGYSKEIAYFECLHEIKLLADLLYEYGVTGMREHISRTALYGDLTRGPRVIDGHVKHAMEQILKDVQSGRFAQAFQAEVAQGMPEIKTAMEQTYHHPMEETGRQLRQNGVLPH